MFIVTVTNIPLRNANDGKRKLGSNAMIFKDGIRSLSVTISADNSDQAIDIVKKAISYDENHWEFKYTTFTERKLK